MVGGLVQLLMALVGAVLISAAVMGFRAEWQALFKKPFGAGVTRIMVYALSAIFQMYSGYTTRAKKARASKNNMNPKHSTSVYGKE